MELINNIKKELNGINKSEEYFNNNLKTAIDILYSKYPFIDNKEVDYDSILRERINDIKNGIYIDSITKKTYDRYNICFDNITVDLDITKFFIISLIFFNEGVHDVYYKYINDYKFLERTYIRISLLKEGYTFKTIENIINTYYKLETGGITKDHYNIMYTSLISIIDIYNPKTKKIGRPKLPDSVKNILMQYRKNKNNIRMNLYYDIYKNINKLFSEEEIDTILKGINNLNIKEEDKNVLKDKIQILLTYSKK